MDAAGGEVTRHVMTGGAAMTTPTTRGRTRALPAATAAVALAATALIVLTPAAQVQAVPAPTSATSTALTPNAVAVDSSGNVYVSDHANRLVRRFSADGASSEVVVGDGTEGLPAPGAAASTRLINPAGLSVAADGSLYVADAGAGVVLKVDQGVVSVAAGSPQPLDGPPVRPPLPGPATVAPLLGPSGLALDSAGNLFTAVSWHSYVAKVTPGSLLTVAAGEPTTIARPRPGSPATRSFLFHPKDVAVDSQDNLYIADTGNYVVSKVDGSGVLTIVAGNGFQGRPAPTENATWSDLGRITGIAVDAQNNLYLADPDNAMVLKVDGNSGALSVLAGNGDRGTPIPGPADKSPLDGPSSVAVDGAGNVFIGDVYAHRVLKVDTAGELSLFAGTGQTPAAAPPTVVGLPSPTEVGGSFLAGVSTNSDGPTAVTSSTPQVCTTGPTTADGTAVSLLAAGECTLTASVGAGTAYLAATGQPQTFVVVTTDLRTVKRGIVADLAAELPGSSAATKRRIAQAIERIEDGLRPVYWVSGTQLDGRHGGKVYDNDRQAVAELRKIRNPSAAIAAATTRLADVDRTLAATALDGARDAIDGADAGRTGQLARAGQEYADGLRELQAGDRQLAADRPDKAVERYGKAWEAAQRAVERARSALRGDGHGRGDDD